MAILATQWSFERSLILPRRRSLHLKSLFQFPKRRIEFRRSEIEDASQKNH